MSTCFSVELCQQSSIPESARLRRRVRRRLDGMSERGLAPRDSRRDARGAHIFTVKEVPPMQAEYDGRQIVGIDLHGAGR
jgi:hypothetical protein